MLRIIESTINFILDSTGKIATALLIILVGIIAYNVIGRYVFDSSSIGLEELAWHLYSSIFLLGISYAVRTNTHVRVDLIYENRSPKTKAIIDLVGTIILLIPFALILMYQGFVFAKESYSFGQHADTLSGLIEQFFSTGIGEKSQDPGGLNNRFVIKSVIPLSFTLLLLAGISKLISCLRTLDELKNSTQEEVSR